MKKGGPEQDKEFNCTDSEDEIRATILNVNALRKGDDKDVKMQKTGLGSKCATLRGEELADRQINSTEIWSRYRFIFLIRPNTVPEANILIAVSCRREIY